MKKFKTTILIPLLIISLALNTNYVGATSKKKVLLTENNNDVLPCAVANCGKYANHDMLSTGWSRLENTTTNKVVFSAGACFQCTRCNLVCVTQGEPPSQKIGYYALKDWNEKVNTFVIVALPSSRIYKTNSKSIDGLKFRY